MPRTGKRSILERSELPADCNSNQLRRAARSVSRYYDLALAPSGLRSTQYTLLGYLIASGPMTMARLAKAMAMERATLGHNLRPLERDGMLTITVSESDRRARLISITAHGRATVARAHPAWRRAQKGFEKAIGSEEAAHLRDLMDKIAAASFPRIELDRS